MKTNIINIGNSQGVILPAAILRRLGLHTKSSVEIELSEDGIFIKPSPRQGWAEAAIAMQEMTLSCLTTQKTILTGKNGHGKSV
jgi:antitoxin MazE